MAPAYPALIAAGAVVWERWTARQRPPVARRLRILTGAALAFGGLLFAPLMLPIAPVNSALWNLTVQVHDNFAEQIGWPELVEELAGIFAGLPPDEQARTTVLAGNYGEAGAVNLYGPAMGLPEAISGINSYWLRGYGSPPPETAIVVGYTRPGVEQHFADCELAGRVTNRYGVENEETRFHPEIFLCRQPRRAWPELWPELQSFG
jgi:hypothetical protein